MKDTKQTLLCLRNLFKHEKLAKPLAAYIIPSDDEHQSEYISAHDERRAFVSGFDGSAGTAVVTTDKALLWTDGRYYQQAGKQLDENWTLMKDGQPTTPSIGSWLAKNLPTGSAVGVDPRLISVRSWKPIQKELSTTECSLVPVEQNLIDLIWGEKQPARPANPIKSLGLEFTGATVADKLKETLAKMKDKNACALVVSALDEIAWFLNLRGTDIDYNPIFFSYLIVKPETLMLFVDAAALPKNFEEHQQQNKVKIVVRPYNDVGTEINKIVSSSEGKIWIAPTSSYYLTSLVPRKQLIQEITPIALQKAIKNATEVEGFINCHVRDGLALCQYFAWLEQQLENGEYVDEISGADKLEALRSKKAHYQGLSFGTISSSGPNGAVIHYHPAKETNRQITKNEVYLCDSGAQYLDGTTDVTRTLHFGQPTAFQMETYTRVLKGQLTLGATVFPNKVKGQVLDTIARKALWDIGLNYEHGTGHGVGHFLNVHEGPMGVGVRLMPDDPGLQANMFISNEPGYYDVDFGIRIEDIVQIVPANVKHNFAGRGALTFKTVTMCPKQTKMIVKEILSAEEIKQLNDYHRQVRETLTPLLKQENDTLTLAWLERETKEI